MYAMALIAHRRAPFRQSVSQSAGARLWLGLLGCWGLGGGAARWGFSFFVEDTSAQELEKVKFNRLSTYWEGGKDGEACGSNKSVIHSQ
jgi:hypothetical protein